MQQLGFHNSWREAWPSCISFLPSWPLSDNLYTSFFHCMNQKIHFCFSSFITFLSCLLHSGRSFRNLSTENLFLAFYAAWSNSASVASGLFLPVMQNHGPQLCDFLQTHLDALCSPLLLYSQTMSLCISFRWRLQTNLDV